ncbi:unnamed protein product [Sphenostylis stenocarpa]|uniref:Uncharacterized protein n=1 Tax=Sphenostylis stenocarpa TaxID=92480 RepID=A0AA87BDB7_9FABA|nr:unnamed protein product [Sphenostylis stenocarpa]
MLPETEATPAFPMSLLVRLRLSRMIGTRGAAAKVETKQVKKDIQDKWKVLMWGLAKENSMKTLALCSESTGKTKFAVVSVGTIGEATEAMKLDLRSDGEVVKGRQGGCCIYTSESIDNPLRANDIRNGYKALNIKPSCISRHPFCRICQKEPMIYQPDLSTEMMRISILGRLIEAKK